MADVTWLLRHLVETVAHTRGVVLLSADGIAKSWHGVDTDGADQLAAMAGYLCSLAQRVGTLVDDVEGVRQVVAEVGEVVLYVTAASVGMVLAVLAGREVDAGILSREMGQLTARIPANVATQRQHDVTVIGRRG